MNRGFLWCAVCNGRRPSRHPEDARGGSGTDQAHQRRKSAAARDADTAPHGDDDRSQRYRTGVDDVGVGVV